MMDGAPLPQGPDEKRERDKRQHARSVAIALALGAMSLLFYAATIVRMGGNVVNRPLVIMGASQR